MDGRTRVYPLAATAASRVSPTRYLGLGATVTGLACTGRLSSPPAQSCFPSSFQFTFSFMAFPFTFSFSLFTLNFQLSGGASSLRHLAAIAHPL